MHSSLGTGGCLLVSRPPLNYNISFEIKVRYSSVCWWHHFSYLPCSKEWNTFFLTWFLFFFLNITAKAFIATILYILTLSLNLFYFSINISIQYNLLNFFEFHYTLQIYFYLIHKQTLSNNLFKLILADLIAIHNDKVNTKLCLQRIVNNLHMQTTIMTPAVEQNSSSWSVK